METNALYTEFNSLLAFANLVLNKTNSIVRVIIEQIFLIYRYEWSMMINAKEKSFNSDLNILI
jgi:hypothetical protein